MKKKYGILVIVLIFFLAGFVVKLINRFYSFDYLYNTLIKREFAANPRVEVDIAKDYQIRIWYYPFYRTIKEKDEKEFFREVLQGIRKNYPGIGFKVRELSFANGYQELLAAVQGGKAPDIYFNFSNDTNIDSRWQIPVDPYISEEERMGFHTVDWREIDAGKRLWGWPFLVQEQGWIKNGRTEKVSYLNKIADLESIEKKGLIFNYYDLTLLKQLLALYGVERLIVDNGRADEETINILEKVFELCHQMRGRGIFAVSPDEMPGYFLKYPFENGAAMLGPVNPYMEYFLMNRNDDFHKIRVGNLIQVFTINIFRQKRYKGDDHSRAVMEVARAISQEYAEKMAGEIGIKPAYSKTDSNYRKILEIYPEEREYWDRVITPTWLSFWEKDLSPEEAGELINKLDK
ncbi:MAG TPA: hypothetical protein VKY40_06610 [Halanaerobiales bacterium]|nr:hypothetical protein [Halanaerobiales bacterium]